MSDVLARHLFAWACNNAWANLRLHRACAALDEDALRAPRVSFFPSIRATLLHLLAVDRYYVDALERGLGGRPPQQDGERFFLPEREPPDQPALTAAQREVDGRLVALLRGVDDAALLAPIGVARRAGTSWDRADRLIAHLLQHQIHHRGQVHAMLAGTSVAPPQLDELFCAGDAPLRAAELAELGLDEAALWGE